MLSLRLFGPPLIERNELPQVQLKSRKVAALLFYLALMPEPHDRSYLAGLLWSELPEDKARRNLRFAVWNLQRVLEEVRLHADRLTVTFQSNDAVWVDVVEFRQCLETARASDTPTAPEVIAAMQRVVDLYQGDFLAGFDLPTALLFNEWLQQQRTLLRRSVLRVLECLVGYYRTHHRFIEAIVSAERLLEMVPWHEEVHRQMMQLLALNGQRSEALNQFRLCRQVLAEEWGAEPTVETTTLYDRIRAGEITSWDNNSQLGSEEVEEQKGF